MTICPNRENAVPISSTESPVTHTADVAEKMQTKSHRFSRGRSCRQAQKDGAYDYHSAKTKHQYFGGIQRSFPFQNAQFEYLAPNLPTIIHPFPANVHRIPKKQ